MYDLEYPIEISLKVYYCDCTHGKLTNILFCKTVQSFEIVQWYVQFFFGLIHTGPGGLRPAGSLMMRGKERS